MSGPVSSHHCEESCGGVRGSRSDLWRHLSWCIGDTHANRICWVIDLYCRLFGIDPAQLQWAPRG